MPDEVVKDEQGVEWSFKGIDRATPDLTIGRAAEALFVEGPKRALRWHAKSAALESEQQENARREMKRQEYFRDGELSPTFRGLIMPNNPKLAFRVNELMGQGETEYDAASKAWDEHFERNRSRDGEIERAIADSDLLQPSKEFQGGSSGIVEDVLINLPGMAATLVPTVISPFLGVMGSYRQMHGATYEHMEQQAAAEGKTLDKSRAYQAASNAAMVNTVPDMLSNVFQVKAIMGAGPWRKKLMRNAVAWMGEGVVEFVQSYPEEVAVRWALNPDIPPDELMDVISSTVTDPEVFSQAAYEGGIGILTAGLLGGGAHVGKAMIGGYDGVIHPRQRKINEERRESVKEFLSTDNPTADQQADFLANVGIELPADSTPEEVAEIVASVKERILFQGAAIRSDERTTLMQQMDAAGIERDTQNLYLSVWDGIATVAAERGMIESPEAFYKEWLAEIKSSDFAEFSADGRVLGQAGEDRIYQAYQELIDEFGYSNVEIANIRDRAGVTQEEISKYLLRQSEAGAVILTDGDFSVSNEHVRGGAVTASWTDRPQLLARIDEPILSPGGRILKQPGQQPRGAVQYLFEQTPKIIHLFQGKDPSTILHETGHILLAMVHKAGGRDYEMAAQWAGVDADRAAQGPGAWTDAEHEKFAKAFELYFIEGRPPTMGLLRLFRRMKDVLIRVYKQVRDSYFGDVKLDDNVRGVFDRWVATDQQRRLDPFYEIMEAYRIEDILSHEAKQLSEDETFQLEYDEIQGQVQAKIAKRLAEKKQKAEKQLAKQFREEAEKSIEGDPFYEMLDDIIKRGGIKYDSVRNLYSSDWVGELSRVRPGVVSRGGQIEAAVLAMEYGYDSADAMLQEILSRPNKTEAIEQYNDSLWREYEAVEHLANVDAYYEYLEAETELFAEMAGKKKPTIRDNMKKIIRQRTGLTRRSEPDVKALREDLQRDAQVARTAWREAQRLFKEEKAELNEVKRDAIRAEREKQLAKIADLREQHKERVWDLKELYKEQRFKDKIHKKMRKVVEQKSMLPDYKAHIVSILSSYYKIPDRWRANLPEQPLKEFVESKKDQGESAAVDVLKLLIDELPEPKKKGMLSVDELGLIADVVNGIAHLEKMERTQRLFNNQQGLEDTVLDLTKRLYETRRKIKDPEHPIIAGRRPGFLTRMSMASRRYFASLEKPEFIFDDFDGYENLGPHYEAIIKGIKDAEDQQLLLGHEFTKQMEAIFKDRGFGRSWAQEMHSVPGLPDMTKEQMFMALLNSGNEGNRAALKYGNGIDEQHIEKITDLLTMNELQAVYDVWGLIDSFYPKLNEVHKTLTGMTLPKVKGKYFPLVFDSRLSADADKYKAEQEYRDLFASAYHRAHVNSGHRIARTGGKMGVRLDFGVIGEHIGKVLLDVTHQIPVRDAQKIILHPVYRDAVRQYAGPETYSQLMPWLQRIARSERQPDSGMDKFLRRLRKNTTVVALGLKFSVAAQQVTSLSSVAAVPEIGALGVARAAYQFYKNPAEAIRFVNERSPSVRFRGMNFERDLRAFSEKFNPAQFQGSQWVQEAFFSVISMMDKSSAYPAWIAGYQYGLKAFKAEADPEAKAVEYADKIVRQTQASGMVKDLAAIQGGSEGQQLLTMFYSFASAFQNQMVRAWRMARMGGRPRDYAQLAASYWWLMVVPAVVSQMIRDQKIPDIKEMIQGIFSYGLGGLPYFRDLVNGMFSGFGYSVTPLQSPGEEIVRLGKNIGKAVSDNDVDSRKLAKGAIGAAGYVFGLPSGQINTTMDGLLDMMDGKTDNPARLLFREPKR